MAIGSTRSVEADGFALLCPLDPGAAPAAHRHDTAWLSALMLASVAYQLALCALYTHLGVGGRTPVIAAELLLLAACLPLLLGRRLPSGWYLVVALVLANVVALGVLRQDFDAKPLRDLLVPLVFLALGIVASNEATGERVLRRAVWLVLGVALFEFVRLDLFTRVFDVFGYYLARGVGDPDMAMYRDDGLVASGMRPEGIGRTLLPVLGAHRASSVFIEPVSFGNFAVMCAAWGLAKAREQWRSAAFFVAAAAAMVVLADSRFGLFAIGLLLALRVFMVRGTEPLAMALPLLCAAALVALAVFGGVEHADNLAGRLALTGRTLVGMGGREMFGLTGPSFGYYDNGYPYVLANFGLLACLALWIAFWLLRPANPTGRRFQAYVALYLTLILCVSGTSAFAFKTSALLWFLLGSLATPANNPTETSR